MCDSAYVAASTLLCHGGQGARGSGDAPLEQHARGVRGRNQRNTMRALPVRRHATGAADLVRVECCLQRLRTSPFRISFSHVADTGAQAILAAFIIHRRQGARVIAAIEEVDEAAVVFGILSERSKNIARLNVSSGF